MRSYKELRSYLSKNQHTWLITGVAGFIGSNLLEQLLVLNQKVVGIDNFETGYKKNILEAISSAQNISEHDLEKNFTFFEGDIRNYKDCETACDGVEFVLHQAALGSVPRSIENPIRTNSTNIDGFLNIITAAMRENVKRFVYAASSSTYGDHPDLPKIEDRIGRPLSPYAVTKYVNELYAQVFKENYGFKTIGLRYFNIFGKRQDPEGAYAAVIPKWISKMLSNQMVSINGDGETSRDFCFIDNAIQINLLAACTTNEQALNEVYNVALNDRTSLNDLFFLLKAKILKKKPNLNIPEPEYLDFRRGDVRHSLADISKAKTLLSYDPKYRISEGLDRSIDWYVENLK